MSKEIVLSIKPEHLENILEGKKTLELRKTVPKNFVGWVNLYCTKSMFLVDVLPFYEAMDVPLEARGNDRYDTLPKSWNTVMHGTPIQGKIVARFWFDNYIDLSYYRLDNRDIEFNKFDNTIENIDLEKELCLSWSEIEKYSNYGEKAIYAWHIKNLEIFDTPKKLEDFGLKRAPQSWCYAK